MTVSSLGHLYLPPVHAITLEFMKDMLSGKKKALRIDKVIALKIPLLPEFTVEKGLTEFAAD